MMEKRSDAVMVCSLCFLQTQSASGSKAVTFCAFCMTATKIRPRTSCLFASSCIQIICTNTTRHSSANRERWDRADRADKHTRHAHITATASQVSQVTLAAYTLLYVALKQAFRNHTRHAVAALVSRAFPAPPECQSVVSRISPEWRSRTCQNTYYQLQMLCCGSTQLLTAHVSVTEDVLNAGYNDGFRDGLLIGNLMKMTRFRTRFM
ncbi:hypothetical protein V8C26DRAFT_290663 [Trichoderma gracile]